MFEEADGVYVNLQGKDRRDNRQKKAEIKVAIAYDGWKPEGKGRYSLHEKIAVAGFAKSKDFQEYREAVIADKFNLDEVETRVLNGDGGSWIKKVKDKETIFQLDPSHKSKAIRELIHERKAQRDLLSMLNENDIETKMAARYNNLEISVQESLLIAARAKKKAIEAERLTGDNIYKMLIYFDKLYSVMDEQERRQLMESVISEVQIFEEQQPNGQWLKFIKFKLLIIEESME